MDSEFRQSDCRAKLLHSNMHTVYASYDVSRRRPRDWPVDPALRDTGRTTMESTELIYDLIRDMPGTGSFIQLRIREDHIPKISSHI